MVQAGWSMLLSIFTRMAIGAEIVKHFCRTLVPSVHLAGRV